MIKTQTIRTHKIVPALLIILDGWGIRKEKKGNAIKLAQTPNFDKLWKNNLHTSLCASQECVGLPKSFIGNSEVGHTHLGSGRIIPQELVRINKSINNNSFFNNKALLKTTLLKTVNQTKRNNSSLHLMGLLSDGGVHSHINHLFALLKLAKKRKVKKVFIHVFLDGRDCPPKSAEHYIGLLKKKIKQLRLTKNVKIATLVGRFYAMDRDNRWNREHKAYDLIVNGKGTTYKTAREAIRAAYKRGETDEFIKPSIISNKKTKFVEQDDSLIFFNFRSDRARELTRAFVEGRFKKFKRKKLINLNFTCLTQYDKNIKTGVAFAPKKINNTLGEIISKNKLRQLRIAETEKYAHVTFFFNSGRDTPFKNEYRLLIPSPKVTTYDTKPEMSCFKITQETLKKLKTNKYSLIVVNYANADMVGHTGNMKATIKAIESVDKCLYKIVDAAQQNNYNIIITADHGNAEEMIGKHSTSHTTNKVPFIFIKNKKQENKTQLKVNQLKLNKIKNPSITNIAPTILKIMNIKIPKSYCKQLVK